MTCPEPRRRAAATVRTRCSKCNAWNSFEADEKIDAIACGACNKPIGLAGVSEKLLSGGPVDRCCRCGKSDFWAHKDFPKALGLSIVGVAAIAAFWTYGLSLVLAAVIDAGLYAVLPWATVCYPCRTEYRGIARDPAHGGFDLAHQEDVEAEEAERAEQAPAAGASAPGADAGAGGESGAGADTT